MTERHDACRARPRQSLKCRSADQLVEIDDNTGASSWHVMREHRREAFKTHQAGGANGINRRCRKTARHHQGDIAGQNKSMSETGASSRQYGRLGINRHLHGRISEINVRATPGDGLPANIGRGR